VIYCRRRSHGQVQSECINGIRTLHLCVAHSYSVHAVCGVLTIVNLKGVEPIN